MPCDCPTCAVCIFFFHHHSILHLNKKKNPEKKLQIGFSFVIEIGHGKTIQIQFETPADDKNLKDAGQTTTR